MIVDKLPPLPSPAFTGLRIEGRSPHETFSADQMHEYAKQAIAEERERCAQVCAYFGERRSPKDGKEAKAQAWMVLQCIGGIKWGIGLKEFGNEQD